MATELVIKTDRLQKLFDDLEAQKTIISSCTQLFASLSDHFSSLQDSLSLKSQSLESKFEVLASDSKKTLDSFDARENSIPDRESAAAARVVELREAALAEFEKPGSGSAELAEALRSLSRKMDSSGLLKFIVLKRKESVALRAEISQAVAEAVDPPRLVLDAVEEFIKSKAGKGGVTDKRWACAMLVQALFPAENPTCKSPEFSRSMVERAGGLADSWKGEMEGDAGAKAVGPTEAVMFLQLVVGFGLRSRFDDEFLRKLVVEYAARRDMAKLAEALGFGEKMGDIIEELVKNGKDIDAVNFAFKFNLTERFAPLSLLKTALRNSRKKPRNSTMEEGYNMELNSIRAIIKCVEDHNLEADFTLDSLRKRATNLEKAKAERRRSLASSSKPSNKRSHSGSGSSRRSGGGPPPYRAAKTAKYSDPYPSFSRRNQATLPPHSPVARYSAQYSYPSKIVYEPSPATVYSSSYGVPHSHQPVTAVPQQHYSLAVDMSSAGTRTSGSYGGQSSYAAAYDYKSSSAPAGYEPIPYTQQ